MSSVSSLGEDEGIINDDGYKHAFHRIQKINLKITTLIKNWNEESKLAKTPEELAEIDTFYQTYMDQYNARQRTLERLMEIYVEYYKNVTPFETLQPEPPSEQTIPLPTPRTKRTTLDQTTEGMPSSRGDHDTRETTPDGACPKQGQT